MLSIHRLSSFAELWGRAPNYTQFCCRARCCCNHHQHWLHDISHWGEAVFPSTYSSLCSHDRCGSPCKPYPLKPNPNQSDAISPKPLLMKTATVSSKSSPQIMETISNLVQIYEGRTTRRRPTLMLRNRAAYKLDPAMRRSSYDFRYVAKWRAPPASLRVVNFHQYSDADISFLRRLTC